jgi:dTDP-4-dehydrorhamnose reductase
VQIMRIVITGAGGRLGKLLVDLFGEAGHEVLGLGHAQLDTRDAESVWRTLETAQPNLVIHCAALTNVDYCAQYPSQAVAINSLAAGQVAQACAKLGAAMCYISTNEVFGSQEDSTRQTPYREDDEPHPANPYGYSKWFGECLVKQALPKRHYIVRTSWLFAHDGNNFTQKILAAAQAGKPLSVVTDEIATPTYTTDLATICLRLLTLNQFGTYHLVNEGACSRYEFARQILDDNGLAHVPITAIRRKDFKRPSLPPAYSVLGNHRAADLGIRLRPWQAALASFWLHGRQQVPEAQLEK